MGRCDSFQIRVRVSRGHPLNIHLHHLLEIALERKSHVLPLVPSIRRAGNLGAPIFLLLPHFWILQQIWGAAVLPIGDQGANPSICLCYPTFCHDNLLLLSLQLHVYVWPIQRRRLQIYLGLFHGNFRRRFQIRRCDRSIPGRSRRRLEQNQ